MSQAIIDRTMRRLRREEGTKLIPYKDKLGIWTIGTGHNMEADPGMRPQIEVLRKADIAGNLKRVLPMMAITQEQSDYLFAVDVEKAYADLLLSLPWVAQIDEVRQSVLLDLSFNMGVHKLLEFRNTLRHIEDRDWPAVSEHLRASKWYKDVTDHRAEPLITILLTGKEE